MVCYWTTQLLWKCHFGLSENIMGIFLNFMPFHILKDNEQMVTESHCTDIRSPRVLAKPKGMFAHLFTRTHVNSPLLCLLVCRRGRAWRRGSDLCGRRCRATTTPASPRGSRGCRRGASPLTWSLAGPALAAGCSAATPPTPDGQVWRVEG